MRRGQPEQPVHHRRTLECLREAETVDRLVAVGEVHLARDARGGSRGGATEHGQHREDRE
jgi:hypothetical protein